MFVNNIGNLCNSIRRTVYIFVDGIDESYDPEEICKHLIQLGSTWWIYRILVSSRPEVEIKQHLKWQPHLEVTEEMNASDLELHIDHRLETDKKLKKMKPKTKLMIKSELLSDRGRR